MVELVTACVCVSDDNGSTGHACNFNKVVGVVYDKRNKIHW